MNQYRRLHPGEPAPYFRQRNSSNPDYSFDTVGGRYIVLCFFGTANDAVAKSALDITVTHRQLFDDDRVAFFGVSVDQEDERTGRVQESIPGIRHFWDFDAKASRLYGALPVSAEGSQDYRCQWVVLNPALQVIAVLPFSNDGSDKTTLLQLLQSLPPIERYAGVDMHAPVIILPHVLDASLCTTLIDAYDHNGGESSGFMREINGKTQGVQDFRHKRRSDYLIKDPQLCEVLRQQILRKVVPAIVKACCFKITRMERYLVGCYDGESGGHFRPHRDNTTKGTAHRRFALSVNLNNDFDGGELNFPEYGPRSYKMPAGCAVIFSGSLLHMVSPVKRGKRYAFLPFLYDDAAAALREKNNHYLATDVGHYQH